MTEEEILNEKIRPLERTYSDKKDIYKLINSIHKLLNEFRNERN